jgi:hypothetical protein
MNEQQLFRMALISVIFMSPLVDGCGGSSHRTSNIQPAGPGRGDTTTTDGRGRIVGGPEEAPATSGPVYKPAPDKKRPPIDKSDELKKPGIITR